MPSKQNRNLSNNKSKCKKVTKILDFHSVYHPLLLLLIWLLIYPWYYLKDPARHSFMSLFCPLTHHKRNLVELLFKTLLTAKPKSHIITYSICTPNPPLIESKLLSLKLYAFCSRLWLLFLNEVLLARLHFHILLSKIQTSLLLIASYLDMFI